LYWEVFRHGFRRYATYRAATVAGLFTNTVFGFLRAYVLVALFAATATVGGYDLSDALTYVFLGRDDHDGLHVELVGIALAIRSGDIVTDLSAVRLPVVLARARPWPCLLSRGLPGHSAVPRGRSLVFDLRLPVLR
jgi:ABC-type uncharacterized transport system permease subunit